jgi:hypothetical protein
MRHVKLIIFNLNIYKEILDILLIDFSKIIITSISFNFPHGLLCKYEGFDWVYMFLVPLWAFSIFKQPLPLLITLIISPIYHPRHLNLMIIILIFYLFYPSYYSYSPSYPASSSSSTDSYCYYYFYYWTIFYTG